MKATTTGFNPEYAEDGPLPEEIAALPGDAVLEFGAPWCGHCIAASSSIKALLQDHPDWRHIRIYDGKGKPLGRAFRVKLWPTLILLRDGVEISRVVRPVRPEDLSDWSADLHV